MTKCILLLPLSLFTEVLETHNLGHLIQVNCTQMGMWALLVADVKQVTESVVTLLSSVSCHLLVGMQLLLQQGKHHFLIRDIKTKTIS